MKILHVLDSLSRAGAEMLVLDVCRNAAANDLDLSFAALGGGPLERDFENSGVKYLRLQRRLPVDPFVVSSLRKFIKQNDIDVVHAHQAVDGLHAYLATLGTGVRRVLTYQGHFADQKNRSALRYLVPRVSANISCSKGLLTWIKEQGIDTTGFRVVYNGVDRKRLQYAGASLREELCVAPGATIFGMVAHFHPAPRKDQITLCKAFVRAAQQLPDAHLVVVGKAVGDQGLAKLERCKAICKAGSVTDRVHFLGQRDDLAKVTNGLDIHVFSSLHEGLPIALMEAMLTKKPLVLSDIEPHLEASNSGKYALMFRTQDDEDLAAKMLELAANEKLRFELADSAYRYAVETFSIETHISHLKEVYLELLAVKGTHLASL